jgi:hypothetical protein
MTKAELRAQLSTDTIAFVMAGNQIEQIPAKRHRIKSVCKAKTSNTRVSGGNAPSFKISSLYNSVS